MSTRDDLILAYFRSLLHLKRGMKPKEKGAGLAKTMTLPQMEILTYVAEHGDTSVQVLAKAFGVSASAITQATNGLVSRTLLQRRPDPNDRRAVRIGLTPQAKRYLSSMQRDVLLSLQRTTAPLSIAELRTLVSLHAKMEQKKD